MRGRKPIDERVFIDRSDVIRMCRKNGIRSRSALSERMTNSGYNVSAAGIRNWDIHGWPIDAWDTLIGIFGMDRLEASRKMEVKYVSLRRVQE